MGLKELLQEINDEVKEINSTDFSVEVIETKYVPATDDKDITYENLETKTKKCKLIETCVLYIDIRKSTELSFSHQPKTLVKLYSSFIKSMIKASGYYGGHVRNIVGDRIMVIFDSDNCFTNAVNTAILLNTVAKHIVNKHFNKNEVKCGIGIDYGKMLVTKVGTIKHGVENSEYKSLVWLGRPANIASKLTDNANKVHRWNIISEGLYFPLTNKWIWQDVTLDKFVDNLEVTYSRNLEHKNEYFSSFVKTTKETTTKPILITKVVFNEFKKANSEANSIKKGWWKLQNIKVPEYSGEIYGADLYYLDVNDIK